MVDWDLSGCASPGRALVQAKQLRRSALEHLGREHHLTLDQIEALERLYNSAAWWLRHRDCALSHLRALVRLREIAQSRNRLRQLVERTKINDDAA